MGKSKSSNRDLELLYEISCLRFIQRAWKRFLSPDFQNLAEHHLRVIWIALVLAKQEGTKNIEKVMVMALIHDIPESRTGDVDYLQRQYVKRNQKMGISDMLADTSLSDLTSLWEEYEKQKSIEARIVKDADNLDVDLEIREQEVRGHSLGKDWKKHRSHVEKNKLYTESAKRLWGMIQKSNPHDWHLKGRNRFNSGDWKE